VSTTIVAGHDVAGPPVAAAGRSNVPARLAGRRGWADRYPPRPVVADWPASAADRSEVVALVASASSGLAARSWRSRERGLGRGLDWLADQPGRSWQERWVASGADAAGERWADGPAIWLQARGEHSAARLELMTASLLAVVGADVVRPSVTWLLTGGKKRKLARNMIRSRDPEGFGRLALACRNDPAVSAEAETHIVYRTAVIIAAKGGSLADIAAGDVLEVLDLEADLRAGVPSGSATFKVLREMGVFGPEVPSLAEARSAPQRSVEELVDRYPIAAPAVRSLLVDYLKERQGAVDYTTLRYHSYILARCFWADLEAHHPGIDSLALPAEVAAGWKQRLRTKKTTTRGPDGASVEATAERLSYLDVLAAVRAFYLDVSHWALEDPARWGPWAVPCPIRPDELTRRKAVRRRKARMDDRTRQRLPVLPVLVAAATQWRNDAYSLLSAGRLAAPGEEFTAAGRTLLRCLRPHAAPGNVWAEDPATAKRYLLDREEDHAFWAWAVIEVLRLTGVRVEELLELSHHSLVRYRLPDTGEVVPLLQIAPSKTDTERLLVVSPELADVLSAIICRVRVSNGTVPAVRARDYHEHIWMPAAPLLFQRRAGAENHAFSVGLVAGLLDQAVARAGLVEDADGTPLHCSPHDFRRMFITEAVMNGLPPHIAQIIAGHRNINVTMGYKAVYPDEAIQAHLAFLARRRALRPSDEYRAPTDEEWQQFLGHFERRKVSVGTCGRAFNTPCIHEHACVRCSMLWPDPTQRHRMIEIRDNLTARLAEARHEGWLGDVEGLQISLAGAADKLAQMDRTRPPSDIQLATPTNRSN